MPLIEEKTDNWQTVIKDVAYVYSAFLDLPSRSEYSLIRILGTLRKEELMRVLPSNRRNNYSCHVSFWSSKTSQSVTITSDVYTVRYLGNLEEFNNVQFLCNISVAPTQLHDAVVSLSKITPDTHPNEMKLNQNFRRGAEYNYTVCLEQPLYGEISPSWYIVMVDVDELIVPRHPEDRTWTEMIRRSGCDPDAAFYAGRHVLYNIPPNTTAVNKTSLEVLYKLYRNERVYQFPIRAKYIADTMLVKGDMVTHEIFSSKDNRDKRCVMTLDVGGNHHYRKRPLTIGSDVWVLDDITSKFADLLKRRVNHVEKNVAKQRRQ
ncbi:hypothetical protein LSH36_22g10004 [Paralvinella palmiformis]|uniref:Glycosyltransferase family 92 protein n=1 Tax=Paralvinella palmiformis TaxID=53620 RepID=A0AAD9KBB2_9ANNE|nr:hypothetical protein LSH36_22g10004 [Paralvinella palmiformis]